MSATNRSARITKIVAAVKKHYKPAAPPTPRPLFEQVLFACLLENSTHEAAEKAFEALREAQPDWNETRVTLRQHLADDFFQHLTDPVEAADRLKTASQSMFDGNNYSFDLEPLKKLTLGQAVSKLQSFKGVTPFVVAYATQNALGGHSIPLNNGLLTALVSLDVISEAEAAKGVVPGLERAVPKNKGVEIGSILHQLGVEVGRNPYGTNARKVLLAIDPACKDRLPKKPVKEPAAATPAKAPAAKSGTKPPAGKAPAKPAQAGKPAAAKKSAAKPDAQAKPAKKAPAKKAKPAEKAPAKTKAAAKSAKISKQKPK
ncbi:hypothetical protein Pla175_08950 [Pirellulimonas nuda]|uniref:Endonuclease III n=1 Tax=Pirellulimonas nuda TaxID=2528009 RepID=A0A518D7S7_9BACT|nr:hypothetical protein [Pirellulimonas nuda]QDU87533.1 hypothetical protein Pla175_08950 [Pirellulimonas nuda]